MKNSILMALLCSLAGCSVDDDGIVEQQQARWESKRPAEYVIEICGTGFSGGCTVDAVSGQMVVASSGKSGDGTWVQGPSEQVDEPVSGLFRSAHARDDCNRTRLTFDAEFGFVTDVYFDCGEEGYGQRVPCFEAGSVDLSVCQGR